MKGRHIKGESGLCRGHLQGFETKRTQTLGRVQELGTEATYKDLKLCPISDSKDYRYHGREAAYKDLKPGRLFPAEQAGCVEATYKDLKLPMELYFSDRGTGVEATYKDLKPVSLCCGLLSSFWRRNHLQGFETALL